MFFKEVILFAVLFSTNVNSFEDINNEICIGLSNGVSVSIANNCNYYYTCFNHFGFLQNCGENFIYDFKHNDCIHSDEVDCYTQSDMLAVNEDNDLLMNVCKGYIDKKLLRVIGSCSKYYICKNEIGYIDDCKKFGQNFYFESSSGSCVEGNQYICINGNIVHLINRLSFEKIKISPPDYNMNLCRGYEDGNIFGIEGSCNYYYFCADQIAYLQSCKSYGEDFQFDVKINDCNNNLEEKCDEIFI